MSDERDRSVEFGRRLRALRLKRGMTQETLTAAAELDKNAISEAERGRANPTLRTIGKLADALGVADAALVSDDALAAALEQLHEGTVEDAREPQD